MVFIHEGGVMVFIHEGGVMVFIHGLDFYIASSLKQLSAGRHVALLEHIILILSQPVFAFSP